MTGASSQVNSSFSLTQKRLEALILYEIYHYHRRWLEKKFTRYLAPFVKLALRRNVSILLTTIFCCTILLTIYDTFLHFQGYFERSLDNAIQSQMCAVCPHSMDQACLEHVRSLLHNDTEFLANTRYHYVVSLFIVTGLTFGVTTLCVMLASVVVVLCVPSLREHILALFALKLYLIRSKNHRAVYETSSFSSSSVDRQCSICFSDIADKSFLRTWCDHHFHRGCLSRWLRLRSICPYCRGPLVQ